MSTTQTQDVVFQGGTRRHAAHRRPRTRHVLAILAVVLCTMLLEIVLFNLPFWQTRSSEPVEVDDYTLGEGVSRDGDTLSIDSDDDAYIEVHADSAIQYLYLDPGDSPADATVQFQLCTQHIGNTGWYTGQSTRSMNLAFDSSRYVHVGGEHDGVRIIFVNAQGQRFSLRRIVVNAHVPFSFSLPRVSLVVLCLVYCLALRPGSALYRLRISPDIGSPRCRQTWILAAVTVVQMAMACAVWVCAGGSDAASAWPRNIFGFATDYDQYARMGDALLHGQVSLDLPVPDALSSLANPYDSDIRGQIAGDGGNAIFWDHAFYNGNYYMYFGVVPAVLIFVPYQLITGQWLATTWAVLLLGLLTTVALTCLAVQIADKLFHHTVSLGATILAVIALNAGSSMYYQLFTPNFYAVPGLASLCFTAAGLALWLAAKKGTRIAKIPLALGSLCIALNLGCRPQFILVAVLALPLFWDELVHQRLFFSKKGIGNTIAALLPFALTFIPLLAYNYVRFGSPLDFGAQYNLTGFDMTIMKTPLADMIPLVFYYVFQPANITASFPFVEVTQTPLSLWAPAEPSVGGILAICPFLLIVFLAVPILRSSDTAIRRITGSMFALGVVILLIDGYMCGLAWRYYLDFSWLFCLVAVVAVFLLDRQRSEGADSLEARETHTYPTLLLRLFFVGVLASEILQFFSLFTTDRMTPMVTVSPGIFFHVTEWFLMLD